MKRLLPILTVAALAGCAMEPAIPQPSGGNRNSGELKMSVIVNNGLGQEVDVPASHSNALKQCQAWGYSTAEVYPGVVPHCLRQSAYGCRLIRFEITYQCLN